MPLRSQEDVLLTRRRARDLAGLLQLGAEAQSRLATAVWEVARVAHRHGSSGTVELAVSDDPPAAEVAAIIRPVITALDSNAMAATHKDVHPRMRGPRRAATTATRMQISVKTVRCGPRSGHANEDHIA